MVSSLRSRQEGITLIELMISVVVLAVLVGIGTPLFREFVLDQRLRAVGTDLRIALMTARSEAVKRNRTVTLSPSADGWGGGWSIASPNAGDPAILNHVQTGENVSITGPGSAPQFTPSGRALESADFSIQVGPGSDNVQSCLRLGLDGRTSSSKGACS